MEMQWKEMKDRLFGQMDLSRDISDEELQQLIEREVERYSRENLLSLAQREQCERQIFNSFRKLDILQELIDDPEVTEIMVNGHAHIFYEKGGAVFPWEKGELAPEKLADMIQQIVGSANRTVNESQPIVDTRLPDGSRVNIVLSPISIDGSCISIRKFSDTPMTLERLIELDSISQEAAQMLKLLVKAGYNIFVSGGTGSGKTTFLNALSQNIPKEQRVITIEDSAELKMESIPNLVRLETRMGNSSGAQPITIRDLIRTALRMRPDRIIVGEVRGAEALDMLQAMNTGHLVFRSSLHCLP
jgi:pilus assembly protein CpaF